MGTTPAPFPLPTSPVRDYPTTGRNLAEWIGRGLIVRASSSVLAESGSGTRVTQNSGNFTIPSGGNRYVRCKAHATVNGPAGANVGVELVVDGAVVVAIWSGALMTAGSAGRAIISNDDTLPFAPGVHAWELRVFKINAVAGNVGIISSAVSFTDDSAAP